MKRSNYLTAGLLLATLAALVYTNFERPGAAQKIARQPWEYATVVTAYSFDPANDKLNKITGMTEICYVQPNGCRRQEIKHDLDYGLYLQERALGETFQTRQAASRKAAEIAFQKTLAQLGADGWELVGEPDLEFEFVDIDSYNKYENKSFLFGRADTRAVYFKRLKVQ